MATEACAICGDSVPFATTTHVLVNPKHEEGVADHYVCRPCYDEHLEGLFVALAGDAEREAPLDVDVRDDGSVDSESGDGESGGSAPGDGGPGDDGSGDGVSGDGDRTDDDPDGSTDGHDGSDGRNEGQNESDDESLDVSPE